jgi:hypothetical protein
MATQPFRLIGTVINKRAADIPRAVGSVARKCAAVIGENVAKDTPVDSGVARSNWLMGIDQILTYTIPAYAPYIKTSSEIYAQRAAERIAGHGHVMGTGDKEETANLVAVLSQHFTALQHFDPAVNNTIYLSNSLPYMEKLNMGSSPQTAAGFINRAVDTGIAAIRGMKLMGP